MYDQIIKGHILKGESYIGFTQNKHSSISLQVGVQTSQMQMLPADSQSLMWETYDEDVASFEDNSLISTTGLLEQINVTRDASDYLWYITR